MFDQLSRITNPTEIGTAVYGKATGGTTTTLVDASMNMETDIVKGKNIAITIDGTKYIRKVTANTADSIEFPAIYGGVSATAVYGEAVGGQLTIERTAVGISGNEYTLSVIASSGSNDNLSASLVENVLTVFLGKTDDELDDSKNTGTDVATAIGQVPGFAATMTGDGGVVVITETPIAFSGGADALEVSAGTMYAIEAAEPTVTATLTGRIVEEDGRIKSYSPQRAINLVAPITKLVLPTYDGSGQAVHPSVVYIPNGFSGYKWWMAFTPYPEGNDDYENPSIVASNDGVTWVVPDGLTNPVVAGLVSPQWNLDPELIFDGTQLIMYWADSTGKYYRKTSANGTVWSATTELTWLTVGVSVWSAPGIIREGATSWKAWGSPFAAISAVNPNYLALYESTDGVAWSFSNAIPTNLQGIPWHISVYADEMGYHFLVAAYPKGKTNADCSLYYGFSVDGQDITFGTEPIIAPESSDWTSGEIYRSCFAKGDDQTLRIYLSARSGTKWYIGLTGVRLNEPARLMSNGAVNPRPRVLQRWLWKGLEIRGTGSVSTSAYLRDLEMYANKALLIRCSHDNAVVLSITSRIRLGDVAYYGDPATAGNAQNFTIPASNTYKPFMLTSAHLGMLGVPLPLAHIQLQSAVAPTAGSIDVMLIAW